MVSDNPALKSMKNMNYKNIKICLHLIILMAALSECSFPSFHLLTDSSEPSYSDISIDLVNMIARKMAPAHDIVYHYDNLTGSFVDAICNQTGIYNLRSNQNKINLPKTNHFHNEPSNVVYFLNNFGYKTNRNTTLEDLKHSRSLLHIVILQNALDFENIFLVTVRKEHSIIYICVKQRKGIDITSCVNQYHENNLKNALNSSLFLKNTFLKRVYLVMVLEITENIVRLFEICYFCGSDAQKLALRFETKVVDQNEINITYLLSNVTKEVEFNFNDFNSHVLRVAFPHGHFYLGCNNEINTEIGDDIYTECLELVGVEGIMLKEISERLNFRYAFVNPKTHQEEGIWKNMVKDVLEQRVDFAVSSILISESRMKRVDFCSPVGDDPMRVVYMSRPNVLVEGYMVAFVFTLQTWSALLMTVTLLSCLMYASDKYLYTKHVALARCFWMVGSILVEQGIGHFAKIPGRRVLGSWLLCCIIICTVYKAKLTALLINPPAEYLASLDDLASSRYEAYANEFDASLITETFHQSEDPVLRELSKRTHNNLSICNVLKKSLNSKTFLIEEQVIIQQSVNRNCPKIMDDEELSRIRVTKDTMLPSFHGWPFSKNAPYVHAINYYIALFYQNGLQKKWSESLSSSSERNYIDFERGILKTDSSQHKIKLYGPLLMWGFGIIFSIFCFLIEVVGSLGKSFVLRVISNINRKKGVVELYIN